MDARVRELPLRDFSRYIDARPEDGVLRMHLDLFRDPELFELEMRYICLLYTSPSPRDKRQSRMPSSA